VSGLPAHAESVSISVERVTVQYAGSAAPAVRDLDLVVPEGTTMALLGPSGCGKTTLLRAIAGLERPTAGTIRLGANVVSHAAADDSRRGADEVFVASERRRVGMVFQDSALFPHLTVFDNVAFGLRTAMPRRARSERVGELLDLVGLADYAERRPDTLSGGQQQRVALARSLAPRPSVLLLDEPFSALDAGLRSQIRADLVTIIRSVGVTAVFVTHDQDEAFIVGQQVAVMNAGAIQQLGSPEEVYAHPASTWVAEFVGDANVLQGIADGAVAHTPLGPIALAADLDGAVRVLVRPESLALSPSGVAATVTNSEFYGHDTLVSVQLRSGEPVEVRCRPEKRPRVGDEVFVTVTGDPAPAWPEPTG
jgi:iron(III) transport system ATP-binding protein